MRDLCGLSRENKKHQHQHQHQHQNQANNLEKEKIKEEERKRKKAVEFSMIAAVRLVGCLRLVREFPSSWRLWSKS
jgi:hypothetical protein